MKIEDIIREGSTYELTYSKLSILDNIGNIEYSVKNILYDYLTELKQNSVIIELTNQEFSKYMYNARLLSYDIYGNTELYYIILLLNNISSEKDFDFKQITILHPDSLNLLNTILNTESKYIHIANTITDELVTKGSTFNRGGLFENNQSKEINNDILELRYQIESIKRTILDTVNSLIGDNMSKILSDGLKLEIDKINKNLEELVTTTIDNMLKSTDFSNRVLTLEAEVNGIKAVLNTIVENDYSNKIDNLFNKLNETNEKIVMVEQAIGDIVGINIKDQLETMRIDFNKFKDDVSLLLESSNKEILDKMSDDIEDLKSKLGSILVGTKDIVMQLLSPLHPGVQQDSEFFVPYSGNIEQFVIAINSESMLTSNLLIDVQYLDTIFNVWRVLYTMELFTTDTYRIIQWNKDITPMHIRLSLKEGDYDRVEGITTIIRIREKKQE